MFFKRGSDVSVFTWQACNQLGTPGGAKFSERGPNFFNYVQ